VAHKNPNQYTGILVTLRKASNVSTPIPCKRLQRRVLEFLQEAKVRSTEYVYTLSWVGSVAKEAAVPVSVTIRPDTTLEFNLSVTLASGERFVGNLRAPVKCRNDGLTKELIRAATAINERGWRVVVENEPEQPPPKPISKEQRLKQDMKEVLRGLEVELNGVLRDALRLENKRVELTKTISQLRNTIAELTTEAH
jgi:hypothetical protein